MPLTSLEFHHPVVLTGLLSLVATAHALLRFNARPVTEQEYHYPFCLSWPSVQVRCNVRVLKAHFCAFALVAHRRCRQQKESNGDAELFNFQGAFKTYRKSPFTLFAVK